jgi:hypothetical protein
MHLFIQMLKFMWYWPNWIGNISADIIVALIVSLMWPKVRKLIRIWFHINVTENLKNHIDKTTHETHKVLEYHMSDIHKKLDHHTSILKKEQENDRRDK